MQPKISIVIPVYSGGLLLQPAIESILSQSLQEFEIVLVDNNAARETKQIAQIYADKYPNTIRLLHEPIQGLCAARNTGIRSAKGEFIALLDDDDMMMPERLEKQSRVAEENPDASIIFCGQNNIERNTDILLEENVFGAQSQWKELETLVKKALSVVLKDRNTELFRFSVPSTMFFSKEKALKAGLFDTRMDPYYGEDDDFCIRMFFEGDFLMTPEVLISYRIRSRLENKIKSPDFIPFSLKQFNKLYQLMWENLGSEDKRSKEIFRDIAILELQEAFRRIVRFANNPMDRKLVQILSYRIWKMAPFNPAYAKQLLKTFFPTRYYPRLFWFGTFRSGKLSPPMPPEFVREIFQIPS